MKKTFMQKKWLRVFFLWILFILGGITYFLVNREFDNGSLTLGITFVIMGLIYYFRKQQKDVPDEMSYKIWTMAEATTQQIVLVIAAILFIVNTRWYEFSFTINDLFVRFIFGSLMLKVVFWFYYKKHMEKIPF